MSLLFIMIIISISINLALSQTSANSYFVMANYIDGNCSVPELFEIGYAIGVCIRSISGTGSVRYDIANNSYISNHRYSGSSTCSSQTVTVVYYPLNVCTISGSAKGLHAQYSVKSSSIIPSIAGFIYQ